MASEISKVFEKARSEARKSRTAAPLWPKEYCEDTPEAAWAFCLKCKTWDEAASDIATIPDLPALKALVGEWHATKESGQPLFIEKSRRLVVSWLLCALDVWDAGRGRCNIVETGANYPKASDFVWRCWFIYTNLHKDFPSWKLPGLTKWGNEQSQHLDGLALINESIIDPLNSDGESFRGSGYSRVKLEELSSYRYVDEILAQARLVTQGPPGGRRGHIVGVCNASANAEWQKAKKPPAGMLLPSPKEVPFLAYTSETGNRIVRIYFGSDPLKDAAWVAKESVGVPKRKWLQEMELHDKEVEGALWTQELIDSTRVQILPDNITQIIVAVDPSVTDPDAKNKPGAKTDTTGVIVLAVSEDFHGYVLADKSGDYSPLEWAKTVVAAYTSYRANRVIAEGNQGHKLVEMVIHQVLPSVPVQLVHASQGKRARAEPVVGLYELGRIHHVGDGFEDMELEQTTWDGKRSSKSPGRIDALVWAVWGSGIMETVAGGVADRFKTPDEGPTDFIPEGAFFDPADLNRPRQEMEHNEFSALGWI